MGHACWTLCMKMTCESVCVTFDICWDLNEIVQTGLIIMCNWIADIIIKALKMIITLLIFFFYSQH